MTERLNFDTADVPGEPSAVFTYAGRDWTIKSVDEISYTLFDKLGEIKIEDFFTTVLVADDAPAFVAILHSDTAPSLGKVRAIMRGVTEAIAGIPTTPSTT